MKDSETGQGSASQAPLKPRYSVHVFLFVATLATIIAWWLPDWNGGLFYAGGLLSILFAHEMGHYVAARLHGVDVTPPYFLPGIPPFYTFGAFIKMRANRMSRRTLLVVGAAGPICGMVVAVPVYVLGVALSSTIEVPPLMAPNELMIFGDGLLTWAVVQIVFGDLPENTDVLLHPLAYAGWVGFFVTALNLVPIGQLDGGHVGYALFGSRYHRIARVLFWLLVLCGTLLHPVWVVLGIFLVLTGVKHPPITEDEERLPMWCRGIGYTCIVLFVLTFVPRPIHLPPLFELVRVLVAG